MQSSLDPKEAARALALADDGEQAAFFNEFGQYLRSVCNGKQYNQLCYLSRHLNSYGIEVLKELAGYADLTAEGIRRENEFKEETRCKKVFETNEAKVRELEEKLYNYKGE